MTVEESLKEARCWYAEDIRAVAPVAHNDKVVEAFATVPREHYLGAGPWLIHSRLSFLALHKSRSSDPRHLYHDVLVSIDAASGINNGLPSLWALVYDNLDIKSGDRVLQVGAGTGYYTAILAELVGAQGHIVGYEIEAKLAARAASNLKHYANVEIFSGDATRADGLPQCDVVVACAGVTHIPGNWLTALSDKGRMVLPVTGVDGWGFLMQAARDGDRLPVKSLGPCGFYPCRGARLDQEAAAISAAVKRPGSLAALGCYHVGPPPDGEDDIWLTGSDYWISRRQED